MFTRRTTTTRWTGAWNRPGGNESHRGGAGRAGCYWVVLVLQVWAQTALATTEMPFFWSTGLPEHENGVFFL
jgi:hypothetical protein